MSPNPTRPYKKNRNKPVPIRHVVIMVTNGIVDDVNIFEHKDMAQEKADLWAFWNVDQSEEAHREVGVSLSDRLWESSTHEVYLYSVPIIRKETKGDE